MNKAILTLLMTTTLGTAEINAQNNETFIGRQNPTIKERKLTPEILWAMGRIGGYSVSPQNDLIAYNVSYYSVEQNKSHTVIYASSINDKKERLLTTSNKSEISPKFIQNGDKIAYLSPDDKGVMQIWMMNGDGTEKTQLSALENGVDEFAFSPDEKKVIVIQTVKCIATTSDTYPDLDKASGRVINDLMYRHWDEWTETRPNPYIADFDGKEVKNLQSILQENEPYECPMKPFGGIEQLAWSTDSKSVAYTCRKKTGIDYAVSTDADIYLYDLETGKTTNLCKPSDYAEPDIDYTRSMIDQKVNESATSGDSNKAAIDLNLGYDINPQFSPDGKYVAWQSMKRNGYESDRNRLCIYELATEKKFYATEQFDSNVDNFCWGKNSSTLYFIGTWHGTTHVYSTDLKGNVKKITDGQFDYTSVSLCGDKLVCGRQSMSEPQELYIVDPKVASKNIEKVAYGINNTPENCDKLSSTNVVTQKGIEQITFENQYYKENLDWGEVKPRWSKTVDGKDLLSWVILPTNFDSTKKYPTLLYCQGGPQSQLSQFWSYRWNMQIMAANGYVVVAPNRRGLPGFGTEWLEEISTNYGGKCMDDYLTSIDDATNLPYVDKDKLGCVGASFGGYSVYWLAGHHDKRFKCFIAHDGIFNLEQQYLETEEAWFTNWDLGGAFWLKDNEATKRTYANSPHLFVDKWDAPILCIQGEKDYRIVTSQALAAFNAAKFRGIPAQLLIFPDENHWVLKPQNGVLWQRTFFGWLDKWLKK